MSDSVKKVRTLVELAQALNISQPRCSQLKKEGMPQESDGTWDIEKITHWRLLRVGEKIQVLLPANVEKDDLPVANEFMGVLNRYRELVADFKRDRGDIVCGIEAKLANVTEDVLDSITSEEISRIPLRDRLKFIKDNVSSITGLYNVERLERNLSTDNVAAIIKLIEEDKERLNLNPFENSEKPIKWSKPD